MQSKSPFETKGMCISLEWIELVIMRNIVFAYPRHFQKHPTIHPINDPPSRISHAITSPSKSTTDPNPNVAPLSNSILVSLTL